MRLLFYGSLVVAITTASPGPHPTRPKCSVQLAELSDRQSSVSDLDGDGRPDVAVHLNCGATGNCRSLVIVTNGEHCPRLVGEYFGKLPFVLDGGHHGLRDFSTMAGNGCAGQAGALQHLVFNGENYTVAQTLICLCGDEPDAGPRDPRCDSRRFP